MDKEALILVVSSGVGMMVIVASQWPSLLHILVTSFSERAAII